jgi:hypothetical protein
MADLQDESSTKDSTSRMPETNHTGNFISIQRYALFSSNISCLLPVMFPHSGVCCPAHSAEKEELLLCQPA